MKPKTWFAALAAAAAMLLFMASPASAQPVQPTPNEGLIHMTQRVCGSDDSWLQQAEHNGLSAKDRYWLYLGKTYDIQCTFTPTPAPANMQPKEIAPPQPPISGTGAGWTNPLPGTCRPAGGGGQWHAPRPLGRTMANADYLHEGIDLGAIEGVPIGTNVYAAHGGKVTYAGYSGNAGNQLQIRDGDILMKYNHLQNFSVSVGELVQPGKLIGHVGMTGNAEGPHLHVELWINGENKNAANYLPVGC